MTDGVFATIVSLEHSGANFSTYVVKQHGELPHSIEDRPVSHVGNPELRLSSTININNTIQRQEKKERKKRG